jgi:hypothetical protein
VQSLLLAVVEEHLLQHPLLVIHRVLDSTVVAAHRGQHLLQTVQTVLVDSKAEMQLAMV